MNFDEFQRHAIAFATNSRVLTTKGKIVEKRITKDSGEEIYSSPAFSDADTSKGKVFAYETVSQLASYCEACERSCCGYGNAKQGAVTKQVVSVCVKMQHSAQHFVDLIDGLIDSRSNYADFVALLRHRCIKLPLNYLASKLATNSMLFAHVLQYFLCGFGSDEFSQSPKEQRKAEEVVNAFLKCPVVSDEFDNTNGRLLLDAALSPYASAAKMVISDKRVCWRLDSHCEIIQALRDGQIFEETRLLLLNDPRIYKNMSEDERMQFELQQKIERFNY